MFLQRQQNDEHRMKQQHLPTMEQEETTLLIFLDCVPSLRKGGGGKQFAAVLFGYIWNLCDSRREKQHAI